ncbi:prolyl oligopeptidase family serine peptidase [Granulicella sp. 5B5]|uniref:prolyl oligopeptidase family serine peptidase n=1 Tax=Granulicella sp. 5B5 TaxID=1617967 RepID=UPI0015F6ACE1|nr:prolyl oligopeptidase family serine peptidase [Granulicella sp. 5B5]QMV19915.1 prolyl oligopeptidase family serine peptidase [Granulicella sp. 5B5]
MRLLHPRSFAVFALLAIAGSLAVRAQQVESATPDSTTNDKYIWLEDAHGDRAMAWVKEHNAATAKVFEADPRFAAYAAAALKIAEDPNRLAIPGLRRDEVYNLWRDAAHTHGILRKTSLTDYLAPQPDWHTVIDFDALGKKENVSWVNHGLDCLYPGDGLCMVELSAGGEDAATLREFDLHTGNFVDGGFVLPHSKQDVDWLDKDTLLVSRDWGPDSMTASGYPYIIKLWKRGTPLDSATEIFRGRPTDISDSAYTLHDAQGHSITLLHRGVTFFESEDYLYTPDGKIAQLAIPKKSGIDGLLDGRLLLEIRQDWTPAGSKTTYTQGSLLQLNLADVLADPAHLKPTIIFAPTSQEFLQGTSTTQSHLILTTLDHVRGRAYVYTPTKKGWSKKPLTLPENVTVGIVSADDKNDDFVLAVTGFLTPSSLWLGDASKGDIKQIKTQPAQFDASKDVVEQLEATSKDGTKVPYFVVHRKDIVYNGQNPTLLYAYGGFEVSETPTYSGYLGKLWLEHGGVYVLANIRGGGEFGPAWHEAGLKTHRQRIYDDFASVGEDLIARKITSTPHLGIMGGSNGGLLMGVEMTQRPDLWHAVVIEVPLLDMLRFEKIAAGASWVGEYGSVDVPEERAFLAKISPYNQLKPGVKYPEPFIWTTTKDDRVGPQHARKFAAKMEEFHEPFLYHEITEGGHGAGADLNEEARTYAETYIYLTRKLMDPQP